MRKMRQYMPADHRKFIEAIEQRPQIKKYGEGKKRMTSLFFLYSDGVMSAYF